MSTNDEHASSGAPVNLRKEPVDEKPSSALLSETPLRAVWAAGLLTIGWFLLAEVQLNFLRYLNFSSAAFYCLSAAVLGASVYLVSCRGLWWKLVGIVFGLVSALFTTMSLFVEYQAKAFQEGLSFERYFRQPRFMGDLTNSLIAVILCLVAVLLFSVLRKKSGKGQARICALIGAGVYLLARFGLSFRRLIRGGLTSAYGKQYLSSELPPIITAALVIYLICMAVYALCSMPQAKVRLRGLGLVWAWLALIGALATAALILSVPALDLRGSRSSGLYAYHLIVCLSGLIGYLLLICKRRAGLYCVLIGIGLMIGAQLISIVTSPVFRSSDITLLISTLLGALNPLFAWLAVRAADKQPPM